MQPCACPLMQCCVREWKCVLLPPSSAGGMHLYRASASALSGVRLIAECRHVSGLSRRDALWSSALSPSIVNMLISWRWVQAPSMVQSKYPTAFPLKHQQKDMRLALEAAEQSGIMLPVAAAANEMYKKVIQQGHPHPSALHMCDVGCCWAWRYGKGSFQASVRSVARRELHNQVCVASLEFCESMQAMDGGRGDEDFSAVKESLQIPKRPNVDMTAVN